jgi:membrane protein involved in D-alanine export
LWLTDYVFSPMYKTLLTLPRLAGAPLLAANLALAVTMLVSGLWHGTTASFLIFGTIHGVWLVIFRTWDTWLMRAFGRGRVRHWRQRWPVRAAGMTLTFHAAALAFVFFALDVDEAWQVYARLLGL